VRVEVRLYATFAQYAPTQRAGYPFEEELEDTASIADLIRQLEISEGEVHLAIVNGRSAHDRSMQLHANDRVALFPPVGGG